MRGLSDGIAHVSYRGGGVFLPARNPYDRQMLLELAIERVRTKGLVQVLLDNRRWTLQRKQNQPSGRCATCGSTAGNVWSRAAGDAATYCVQCAVLGASQPHLS